MKYFEETIEEKRDNIRSLFTKRERRKFAKNPVFKESIILAMQNLHLYERYKGRVPANVLTPGQILGIIKA